MISFFAELFLTILVSLLDKSNMITGKKETNLEVLLLQVLFHELVNYLLL
jgi:hypothetical protein